MSWYKIYDHPKPFRTGPISHEDEDFDALFITLPVHEELEKFMNHISGASGIFWTKSSGSGYGKSTTLSFIARKFLLSLDRMKVIPLLIQVAKARQASLRLTFLRQLIYQFYDMSNLITSFSKIGTPGIIAKKIAAEYNLVKEKAKAKRDSSFGMSESKAEIEFREITKERIPEMKNRWGIQFALLVDEMDKQEVQDAIDFLRQNQSLFQDLESLNFLIFFSGDRPWVDRIYFTTENSYFQGSRLPFEIPPLIDIRDVRRLIETRQYQYAGIPAKDSPWAESAFTEILEHTGGVPRFIIARSSEILSNAYEKKVNKIGSGFVKEVLISGPSSAEIRKYISENHELYYKLKRANEEKVLHLIPIIHASYSHRIGRSFDSNQSLRKSVIGAELGDSEWRDSISILSQLGCIIVFDKHYQLAYDIVDLLDLMMTKNLTTSRVGELIPALQVPLQKKPKIPKPNLQDVILRVFKRSTLNRWLSRKKVLSMFMDSWDLKEWVQLEYSETWKSQANKMFSGAWSRFKQDSRIVCFEGDEEQLYARLPDNIQRPDYDRILCFGSKEVIDMYWDALTSNPRTLKSVDESHRPLFETMFQALSTLKRVSFEPHNLETVESREKMFRGIGLSEDVRRRVNSYFDEKNASGTNVNFLLSVAKRCIQALSEEYCEKLKMVDRYNEAFELEARVRELVRSFDGGTYEIRGEEIKIRAYKDVTSYNLTHEDNPIEIDIYAIRNIRRGRIGVLLAECKLKRNAAVKESEVVRFLQKIKQFEAAERQVKPISVEMKLFFTLGEFEDTALEYCQANSIIPVSGIDLNGLLKTFQKRTFKL